MLSLTKIVQWLCEPVSLGVIIHGGTAFTDALQKVNQLLAGSNITLDPTSGVGVVEVSSTGGGGGSPGGSNGQIQYNNSGSFGGLDSTGTGDVVRETAPTIVTPTVSGIATADGAQVTTASAMGALAVDVTKRLNTKTVAADSTLTFSGTPASSNTWFSLQLTNSDSNPHTITIPSSFSINRNAAITSFTIPASAVITLTWQYNGSSYNIYGDPVATTGTGNYVLQSGPTMQGAWQQDENSSLRLDAALSADGAFCGITEAGTAGATLAFGDLCYLAVADSRWELTDADAASTSGGVKLGICVLAAAADGDPTVMLLWGKVRADAAFPTLTVGAPAYVSTTAGDIQVAQPSGTDDVVRVVGYGNTADELYFTPSQDYITVT